MPASTLAFLVYAVTDHTSGYVQDMLDFIKWTLFSFSFSLYVSAWPRQTKIDNKIDQIDQKIDNPP